MAEIVFGMAVPHSGMLGKPADTWPQDGQRDRDKPELCYRNRTWTFAQLAAERKGEGFEALITPAEMSARSDRCSKAIAEMQRAFEAADADVAIILGKDQKEIFVDLSPSIAIYSGDEVYNGPPQRPVWAPDTPVTHQAHPELALHLIRLLEHDGFDISDLFRWPGNSWLQGSPVVPHAFGFVYHRIMGNQPPPHVPILVNTFYPPTQPSMPRSIEFGRGLLRAIRSWDSNKRVAIIASGGLSHFVCDEAFDRKIIDLLGSFDFDGLARIDDRSYQSGTSEIKLYAAVLVAMADIGAAMNLVDYVPCYRTEAGTGEGMGFMYWSKDQ